MRNDLFEYKHVKDGIFIKTYIGDKTTVVIPKTIDGKPVVKIGDNAFINCVHLTSIEIPESVTSIGMNVFSFCSSLMDISVVSGNTIYHSKDNCIIETKTNALKVGCKNTIIPDYVTSIQTGAFRDCQDLQYIEIPESVTNIGEYAFAGCRNLIKAFILGSVTNIGEGAFSDCYRLAKVVMMGSVTSVGESAFEGCRELKKISLPNTIISIGAGAFSNCNGLKSIEIPESVTSIGDGAFSGCANLNNIVYNQIIENFKQVFNGCKITERQFLKDNSLVKKRGKRVPLSNIIERKDAEKLMRKCQDGVLIIPEGTTSIGDGAFCKRNSLRSVILPNSLRSIGKQAFSSCGSLRNVEISEGVTSIGDDAFSRCYGLESISIPSSVISIGADAFYDCIRLERVNITNISAWLNINFANRCANPFGGSETFGYVSTMRSGREKLYLNDQLVKEIIIPEDITRIKPFSFFCYKKLKKVIFNDKITDIGNSAFSGCVNLQSIDFPGNLTNIGDNAFSGCIDIESIEVPGSVKQIGKYAFRECRRLTSIGIQKGVKSIGDGAFSECKSLTSIEIPEGVESIGDEAFSECSNLTSINISGSVKHIGGNSFSRCGRLKNIEIPEGVESIGDSAFGYCSELTSINIPSSVTNIGTPTFARCSKLIQIVLNNENKKYCIKENCLIETDTKDLLIALKNVTDVKIPTDVVNIRDYAFEGCYKLTKITMPSSIKSIGENAFEGCERLTSIEIPEGVTYIGGRAFADCYSINNIEIPEGVENIGDCAFSRCHNLKNMTIKNPNIKLGENLFEINEHGYHYTRYGDNWLNSLTVPIGFRITKKVFGDISEANIHYVHINKPTSSLDENGEKIYDYGDKQIKVKLLSNMKFECYDLSNNKKIRSLPRATKKEDTNLINSYIEDFKNIKYEVEEKVDEYQPEIIKSLTSGVEFSRETFNNMFINTIATTMATGVLWGLYDHNDNLKCAFRILGKDKFVDIKGNKIAIGEDDIISIVDASQLSMTEVSDWKQVLWNDNKAQMVRQFEAPIYYVPLDKLNERYQGATLAKPGIVETPYIELWNSPFSRSLVINRINIKPFDINTMTSHEKRLLNRSIIDADKASLAYKRIENLVVIGDLQGIKKAKDNAIITVDNIAFLTNIAIEHENAEVTAYLMDLKREMLGDIVDLDWEI